jgi:hypothetical protein
MNILLLSKTAEKLRWINTETAAGIKAYAKGGAFPTKEQPAG